MLEGIGKMKRFSNTIEQAKGLTTFIYSFFEIKGRSSAAQLSKKRSYMYKGTTSAEHVGLRTGG